MEEKLIKNHKLHSLIVPIAFLVGACSHTISQQPESDPSLEQTSSASTAQKPDIIVPLLSETRAKDSKEFSDNHNSIWNRIGNSLELSKFYSHPRVEKQKQKFLNGSEYLTVVTKRSEPFIHFVLEEIEKRQMPTELAILPIIESGYYPRARSRAKAEGLWQIMPFTGKELGLKRSYSYDGRHDVYAATSAALDYLQQMHRRFDGDWLLALAAYNAGPQRVKRALKSSQNFPDENAYWDLPLPRETRNYVPKLFAIASIVKDQETSNLLLHPINNQPYLTNIKLSKRISPAKLIKKVGASESEIKLLNPALRNLNTPIHAGYQFLVPKQDFESFAIAINDMPEEEQPLWAKHKINRGESLSGIARRYGTSVFALREANNLHNNTIVAGKTLVVPTGKQSKPYKVAKKANSIKSANNQSTQTIAEPYIYKVAMGDSFWKIANRNNTTVQRLFEINGRTADQPLQPGESILID